ncbi:mitochondrial ribosomal protein subunit L20-domain-containing protein [Lasiosphaeria hispida]|uniref:Mitochondrial ribosomal protein subunit L20-domain-containing protein n=1 Tax=Lasiosphaeria hispida TaxID=260671 RepID=A0AAJ0MHG9_9PEZI|nr:mitochondrial ribosomal protein subunit L20-domain-containing protein [Lasiosphaeria hispida]
MEAQLTRRTAASCCQHLILSSASSRSSRVLLRPVRIPTTAAGARKQSTRSRTKRALNIPPHPSFLEPQQKPGGNHIVFNPPASAPSVFHTPFKFLPKSDPRRRANLPASLFASSTTIQYNHTTPSSTSQLDDPDFIANAPLIGSDCSTPKPHHLTPTDVEEIRRLRTEDPVKNSVAVLSERYKCSKLFIMMCVSSPREHRDKIKSALEMVRQRWGPRRAAAREDRRRRWEMLFNSEL